MVFYETVAVMVFLKRDFGLSTIKPIYWLFKVKGLDKG